jgi:hypothetical protein
VASKLTVFGVLHPIRRSPNALGLACDGGNHI